MTDAPTLREIARRNDGRWQGRDKVLIRCPAVHHDDRNPSCLVSEDPALSGGLSVYCFAGCDWRDIKDGLGIERPAAASSDPDKVRRAHRTTPEPERARDDSGERVEQAIAIWRAACPVQGTPAEPYLQGRHLHADKLATDPPGWPETLGWCDDADGHGRGALVAAVNDGTDGCVRGVQRIFLYPDGSPVLTNDGKKDKRSRGLIRGNAARLSCWPHPEGWWGLAEGVETALAVLQLMGLPTWAAISGSNMANVRPPHWARHAFIFADHDANGTGLQQAAKALARIKTHPNIQTARVLMAQEIGRDAADLVTEAA